MGFLLVSSSSSNIATFHRLVIVTLPVSKWSLVKAQAMASKVTLQKEVLDASGSTTTKIIKTRSCYLMFTFDIYCLQVTFSEALRRKRA